MNRKIQKWVARENPLPGWLNNSNRRRDLEAGGAVRRTQACLIGIGHTSNCIQATVSTIRPENRSRACIIRCAPRQSKDANNEEQTPFTLTASTTSLCCGWYVLAESRPTHRHGELGCDQHRFRQSHCWPHEI